MTLQVYRNHIKVFGCFCDSLLLQGSMPVFISLFGSTNTVRSVWASLIEGSNITIGGEHVKLSGEYSKIMSPLKEGKTHVVFLHEYATTTSTPTEAFFQVGEHPEVDFFPRLDRLSNVPFRKSWAQNLWNTGLNGLDGLHKTIQPLDGFGMPGYRVDLNEDNWVKIAQSLITVK